MKFIKTTLLMTAMLAVFSTQLFSQSVKLGIEGGMNLSNSSFTPDIQSSSRSGMLFGGFAEIKVSPIISIKPGIRYIMKGFSVMNNGGFPNNFKVNYIEVPALLKVTFPVSSVKPYIEAGPTFSLRVSANEEINLGNQQQAQESDVSQLFESTDIGLYFGSGMDFRVGNNAEMFTGIGYGLGLTNTISSVANLTAKNNGFRIITGVKFDL